MKRSLVSNSVRDADPGEIPGGALGMLSAPLTPELVAALLHEVIDPELGVNIVDLGLVRELTVDDGGAVRVAMTLTTPGCPLGGFLEDEIDGCLSQLPQVRDVCVELVWEPPWHPDQMSDAARADLGWMG